MIREIVENPVFVSMSTTILAWVIFYGIVYCFSVQQGLRKDIVRNAYNYAKKIQKIASSLKSNAEIDAKNDAKNDISVSFKQLKRIKHYGRRASTILQVYLLEEDENLDIRAAETRLRQINTECGDVARAYRVDSSVVSLETEIEDVIRLASESASILKSVIKTREENKLLEI